MKKKNSVCEFSSERSRLLLMNFRESLARQSEISAQKAFSDAVSAPAPRFWVSEVRATHVIRKMLKGENPLEGMFPEKARMFREIYRRVCVMRKKEPRTPLGDLVFRAVNSEAPCFYMSTERARRLIRYARS